MRILHTPSLSTKIATGLDIAATLAVEQIGTTFKLPFYHPVILGVVGGLTFVLFAWKDEITQGVLMLAGPIQNKNAYSYRDKRVIHFLNGYFQRLKSKLMKKKAKKTHEAFLLAELGRPN